MDVWILGGEKLDEDDGGRGEKKSRTPRRFGWMDGLVAHMLRRKVELFMLRKGESMWDPCIRELAREATSLIRPASAGLLEAWWWSCLMREQGTEKNKKRMRRKTGRGREGERGRESEKREKRIDRKGERETWRRTDRTNTYILLDNLIVAQTMGFQVRFGGTERG
jgi:hypothetical protein